MPNVTIPGPTAKNHFAEEVFLPAIFDPVQPAQLLRQNAFQQHIPQLPLRFQKRLLRPENVKPRFCSNCIAGTCDA
jgi:hypothetical protein